VTPKQPKEQHFSQAGETEINVSRPERDDADALSSNRTAAIRQKSKNRVVRGVQLLQ
jgi:hypothetical protein